MRAFASFAGVLIATHAVAAEPLVFYTASFKDKTSVEFSVHGTHAAGSGDYDFDVAIGLVKTGANGVVEFEDKGGHRARVRCSEPAAVGVGARDYPIDAFALGAASGDWKMGLWATFCTVPSS